MFKWISWRQSKANKTQVSMAPAGHILLRRRGVSGEMAPLGGLRAEREVVALRTRILLESSAQTSWHITYPFFLLCQLKRSFSTKQED